MITVITAIVSTVVMIGLICGIRLLVILHLDPRITLGLLIIFMIIVLIIFHIYVKFSVSHEESINRFLKKSTRYI